MATRDLVNLAKNLVGRCLTPTQRKSFSYSWPRRVGGCVANLVGCDPIRSRCYRWRRPLVQRGRAARPHALKRAHKSRALPEWGGLALARSL